MSMTCRSRKTFLSFVSFVSFVVTSAPVCAVAQTFESVGIRAQGMGGAYVAVANDATATWWNPAGLATGAYFNGLVEYGHPRTPADTSIKAVAFAFPALGLSYYRLPINQIRAAASTGTDATSRQEQGVLSVYGATGGQSIGKHLVLASTAKLVRAGETHGDLDMGAMARFGVARLGVVVKNIRKPSFDMEDGVLELQRQARVGAAVIGRSPGRINEIALAFDGDLTTTSTKAGDVRHVAGGLDVLTLGKKLGLRVGASANTIGERRSALSAGASVILAAGSSVSSYLDAQVTGGSDEAKRGWGIGLRVTF
jgi:hypothetical protein